MQFDTLFHALIESIGEASTRGCGMGCPFREVFGRFLPRFFQLCMVVFHPAIVQCIVASCVRNFSLTLVAIML